MERDNLIVNDENDEIVMKCKMLRLSMIDSTMNICEEWSRYRHENM